MALFTPGPDQDYFDWEKFDAILKFGPTRQMCADIMECSIETIKRRVTEKHDTTFEEYKEMMMSKMKLKLHQKAMIMALDGNVPMLIFSLKNKCGWKDNPDAPSEPITGMEF